MRKIFVILSILLLISCGDKQQKKDIEETTIVYEKLDSNLVEGVLRLVELGDYLKYPDIPLKESFIIMMFYVEMSRSGDSVVVISHFDYFFAIDNELIEYKGMLNIEGYNIAIFEDARNYNNFGHNFYNVDSLQQIPLENFKRYPIKNTYSENFRVCNGELKYTGLSVSIGDPPPSANR
jgi:hypothetical protein